MGSKSDSKSSNKSTNKTEDRRIGADNGAVIGQQGSEIRIRKTPDGAFKVVSEVVDEAFAAAEDVVDIGGRIAFDGLGFAQRVSESQAELLDGIARESLTHARAATEGANQIVERALVQSQEDSAQLMEKFIGYAIPAAAIVLVFWSFRNG